MMSNSVFNTHKSTNNGFVLRRLYYFQKISMMGNNDSNTTVRNKFDPPIITRFLRIYPREFDKNRWMGMRVELYGCPAGQ